jgi:hypothetical protein
MSFHLESFNFNAQEGRQLFEHAKELKLEAWLPSD